MKKAEKDVVCVWVRHATQGPCLLRPARSSILIKQVNLVPRRPKRAINTITIYPGDDVL